MTIPKPKKQKGTTDTPDYRGEIGPFCPECERKHGIKTPLIARQEKGTGKLYFGCPNFDPPYDCRFNGCRDSKLQDSLERKIARSATERIEQAGANQEPDSRHLETIANHIARITSSVSRIEDTISLFIIAQYGTDEDRARIVKYLKGQFEAFREASER